MTILKIFIVAYIAIHTSGVAVSETKKDTSVLDFIQKFHQSDYKLEFERAERVSYNKRCLNPVNIVTFKYNRTATAINITWKSVRDIGYDYNVVIQAYKFASNEYRLFPMQFQLNFCESIKENVAGLRSLSRCGNFTGCPLMKVRVEDLIQLAKDNQTVHICNWSPDEKYLPPLVPNGRYMIELQGLYHTEEMYLARAYFTIYRPILKK